MFNELIALYNVIFSFDFHLLLTVRFIVVDCGPPGNPVNGQVDISSRTIYNHIVTYTCITGYILTGTSTSTCGSDGAWSPAAPTCESEYILFQSIC